MIEAARAGLRRAFAAAKVNLYLHVGAPDATGCHPISSLVAFADVGDEVSLEDDDHFELRVTGAENPGPVEDNLVLKAARALAAAAAVPLPDLRLTLEKRLPVAAGLGGGSADAAATLRLLNGLKGFRLDEVRLRAVAASLGADVPMCLAGRPAIAEGYGERLAPAPELPDLDAVLVNPRAPCPTAEVYRQSDRAGAWEGATSPPLARAFSDAASLAGFLASTRNDLEPAATAVQPRVEEAMRRLRAAPEALFVRMSGSGATCFALCPGAAAACALARRLSAEQPEWWVRACRIGGPWPDLRLS